MVDRDLVEQARRGDREAFAVLVHQVSDSLYAVAQRILRDPVSPRTRCRTPSCSPGAGSRTCGNPTASRPGSIASSSTPATTNRSGLANGRPTSGSCPSMGHRPRTAAPPSPTATSWSGRSAGSRSISGRSSSCTTTSGCRSWRSPSCWRSPRARPDRACTTPLAASATASTADAELEPQRRTSRMTDDRSLERAARSWLEAGPTQAPDRAVEAALLRIETTPQERDLRIPWRFTVMTTPARVAAAAVIGVLLVGGAVYMLSPGSRSGVGAPGPSPSAVVDARHRRHRPRRRAPSRPMPCLQRSGVTGRRRAGHSSQGSMTRMRHISADHRLERRSACMDRDPPRGEPGSGQRCIRSAGVIKLVTPSPSEDQGVTADLHGGPSRALPWSRARRWDVPHPDRDRRPVRRPQHDVVPDMEAGADQLTRTSGAGSRQRGRRHNPPDARPATLP